MMDEHLSKTPHILAKHFNVVASKLVINEMKCVIKIQFILLSHHIIAMILSCLSVCKIKTACFVLCVCSCIIA